MKTKKLMFLTSIILGLLCFSNLVYSQEMSSVNIEESNINWKGYKVTGSHEGTLKLSSGTLETNADGMLTGGTFVINMSSLDCTDLEAGAGKEKLEGHLMSPDFFGTEQHPEATLKITNVASRGAQGDYKITADLTIKGITKSIKFNALVGETSAQAKISIDRTEFDVRYGSGSFIDSLGDKTIYDEFDLDINLALMQ